MYRTSIGLSVDKLLYFIQVPTLGYFITLSRLGCWQKVNCDRSFSPVFAQVPFRFCYIGTGTHYSIPVLGITNGFRGTVKCRGVRGEWLPV